MPKQRLGWRPEKRLAWRVVAYQCGAVGSFVVLCLTSQSTEESLGSCIMLTSIGTLVTSLVCLVYSLLVFHCPHCRRRLRRGGTASRATGSSNYYCPHCGIEWIIQEGNDTAD